MRSTNIRINISNYYYYYDYWLTVSYGGQPECDYGKMNDRSCRMKLKLSLFLTSEKIFLNCRYKSCTRGNKSVAQRSKL